MPIYISTLTHTITLFDCVICIEILDTEMHLTIILYVYFSSII
jgi:hypothetical protein